MNDEVLDDLVFSSDRDHWSRAVDRDLGGVSSIPITAIGHVHWMIGWAD